MSTALSGAQIEFLRWLDVRPRTYEETMESWRTSCPRLSLWEDSTIDGLVAIDGDHVVLTSKGRSVIEAG